MKTRPIIASIAALSCLASSVHAQDAPAAPAELIKNGSLEEDSDNDGWPDHWPRHKNATMEGSDGKRYLRLKSTEPDATVLLFQKVAIPAGAKKLEFKWKQRVKDLKPGAQPWFDARIMLEFRNDSDQKVGKAPSAPYTRKDTDGWQERSLTADVPEGATWFVFMPALFRVEAGTFELDDFSLVVKEP